MSTLEEAGIRADDVYVTNAVKHFKWRPSGRRRIHDKPTRLEVKACLHWLRLELAATRPRLVVCLGVTAAQAVLGPSARVGVLRGRRLELEDGTALLVTIHPSAVLRARDDRAAQRAGLLRDLELARRLLASPPARQTSRKAKS